MKILLLVLIGVFCQGSVIVWYQNLNLSCESNRLSLHLCVPWGEGDHVYILVFPVAYTSSGIQQMLHKCSPNK